jgi:hypothetical protein
LSDLLSYEASSLDLQMIADVSTFTLKEFGENALSAEVEAEIDVIVPKLVLLQL